MTQKMKEEISEQALKLGFELVGFTPSHPVSEAESFQQWLEKGYAGTMGYLNRGAEKRKNPDLILSGVKTIISVGMNYYTEEENPHIARYALGQDYHEVMGQKLKSLEAFIQKKYPDSKVKSYVDTGAILERSYAAKAGLGWIGKNTCLINNGLGSFFFIGEILTTLEFSSNDYDIPALDQCGTCTKCLDACPTNAFVEPYVMDARKCISYLTIEYRGEFDVEQSKMVGEHVYGCDICQTVCPYNERIPTTSDKSFFPRPEIQALDMGKMATLSEPEFKTLIEKSPMDRVKYPQWTRNVKSVLENKS